MSEKEYTTYDCIYIKDRQNQSMVLEVWIVATSGEEEDTVKIGARGGLLGCS